MPAVVETYNVETWGHHPTPPYGIYPNFTQFAHQLVQVFLVGLTLGMTRIVIPALAEAEFGVAKGSFLMLVAFVVAFGLVKGILNFVAGRLSESWGRKNVLLLGWGTALPIPFMIWYAPTWNWIVAATVLLGVNQGLTWSMTQTAKLDITSPQQRGLVIGLNEFSGYFGVACAGIITGYLADIYGPRLGLLGFGLATVLLAGLMTMLWVRDTRPWVMTEAKQHNKAQNEYVGGSPAPTPLIAGTLPQYPSNIALHPSTWEVFALMSWRDARMAALCQAGLVEKFVDALVWVLLPGYLYQRGLTLTEVGGVIAIYGFTWGLTQLVTGPWSDRVGRKLPIVLGMWLCSAGVGLIILVTGRLWWSIAAAISGFGMALLYPTLSAAVVDIAHPNWRGLSFGIYRFWRDLGYGVGALALGAIVTIFARVEAGFIFTAAAMFVSGAIVLIVGSKGERGAIPHK